MINLDTFYDSEDWHRKRKQILVRDKYQCTICRRYGKFRDAKIVHHIKPLEEYPELALDDDNLTSLCQSCHNKVHQEKYSLMRRDRLEKWHMARP